MADPDAAFLESLTAACACRSWFCRDRGPFVTRTLAEAELLAAEHRALRWLGVWHHRVIVYRLDGSQLEAGQALADFCDARPGGTRTPSIRFVPVGGSEADSGGVHRPTARVTSSPAPGFHGPPHAHPLSAGPAHRRRRLADPLAAEPEPR